jgi:hypothetical protein
MGNTPSSPPPGHGHQRPQPPPPDHYPLCDDEGVFDAKTCEDWCGGVDTMPTSYWDTTNGKKCTCSNCSMRTCPDHPHECQRSAGHPPAPKMPPFAPGETEYPWQASKAALVGGPGAPLDVNLMLWLVSATLVVGVVAYSVRKRQSSRHGHARSEPHERLPLWSWSAGYGSSTPPLPAAPLLVAASA